MKVTNAPDFRARYANTICFLCTEFDLRVSFGEVKSMDAGATEGNAELHTDVTLSLAAAKTLAAYLLFNLAAIENARGLIRIPSGLLPQEFEHLAGMPVTDLIAEVARIEQARQFEAQPPASGLNWKQ